MSLVATQSLTWSLGMSRESATHVTGSIQTLQAFQTLCPGKVTFFSLLKLEFQILNCLRAELSSHWVLAASPPHGSPSGGLSHIPGTSLQEEDNYRDKSYFLKTRNRTKQNPTSLVSNTRHRMTVNHGATVSLKKKIRCFPRQL